MKTFKQMNEDIQHQMQLNEKGLLKKLKRVKDAAVNAFKDSPEKHAEKMKRREAVETDICTISSRQNRKM